jgi:hypothetical protein
MATTISYEAIEKATGKSWSEWLSFFEDIGADQLDHKEIAQKVGDLGGAPPWWRQMVTVAYEQHIGRRAPGQNSEGQFAVSVGKTVAESIDEAVDTWKTKTMNRKHFSGIPITRGPEMSRTEKWRYWRCGLADRSRIIVNFSAKLDGRTVISIQHENLESSEQTELWRRFWKDFLKQFT